MDMRNLLLLYKMNRGNLPSDITVVNVPIKAHAAYGDFSIQGERKPLSPPPPGGLRESITLEKYVVLDEIIYAGFGEKTRTLLIGKPVSNGSGAEG